MNSDDRLQFDSTLGGKQSLPDEVSICAYAAARSKEIAAMTECIKNPCRTKLVFQSLPVHMRRRVMSHNAKRLPRRLRVAHQHQLDRSGPRKPSRRKRRRPATMLADFARRGRLNRWLETHVWHAKRFRMTKRWGYSLPEAPCDKAFRACYRAASAHCLLQDVSYLGCVQITAQPHVLSTGFSQITDKRCGLTLAAKAFSSGNREGSVFIFKNNQYPFGCIGKVSYLWKPKDSDQTTTVWMFAHPTFYQNLIDVLTNTFTLKPTNDTLSDYKSETQYSGASGVTVVELKDTINRFRLIGPLSHAVLNETLKFADENDIEFKSLVQSDADREHHATQMAYWKAIEGIETPAQLQKHIVVAANVEDPRLHLPSRRTKAMPRDVESCSVDHLINIPEGLSHSRLWSAAVRKNVTDNKPTTHEINKHKEENNLVPGGDCTFKGAPKIPIVLLQRPGSKNAAYKRLGFGAGWDVIIPGGYAMPFWLSFVLRGARTGGIRESSKLAFESGLHDFYPDTNAGRMEAERIEAQLREKYFRLPPDKRVNFNKLSIRSPFLCLWSTLIKDWNRQDVTDNFYVLRDTQQLKLLQDMTKTRNITSDIDWMQNCLIPVRVTAEKRGKITDFALICLPKKEDNSSSEKRGPIEALKKDENESVRNNLRQTHKLLLKRLRSRAVRKRKRILEKEKKYVHVPKQDNSIMINEYSTRMRELWLPSAVSNVRHQCSRETVGFVRNGQYTFTEAKGSGLGFVTLASFKSIIESHSKCLVLTRNTLSRQYHFARLDVICEN